MIQHVRSQHYVSLPFGVDVLLGKNGYIWITSKLIAVQSSAAVSLGKSVYFYYVRRDQEAPLLNGE